MQDDELGVDSSIRLIPIDAPGARARTGRRTVPYLLIGLAALLGLSVILVVIAKLAAVWGDRSGNLPVAAQQDPAVERAEAVAIFNAYDALRLRHSQRSANEQAEWESIELLFGQLQSAARAKDDKEFRRLVDFNRLFKRIDATGNTFHLSFLDKRLLQAELKRSVTPESTWDNLAVAGVVIPSDEPNSRIVYVYGRNAMGDEQSESRFWIGRADDAWKIYDWQRLDLGLSVSQEWGLYSKYARSPAMRGYQQWTKLVGEADELTAQLKYEEAREKLRQAETETVPDEFEDYHWLLTGYRWTGLSEYTEAERCFNKIRRPDDVPGAYFSMIHCKRWSSPQDALRYADQYEAATGPSPDLLQTKAELLKRLKRDDEAVVQWKKLLRIEPENEPALAALYLALPRGDKSEFEAHLAQLDDPVSAAVGIASTIGYRKYDDLATLSDYLQRVAPNAAGTFYVRGFAKQLNGEDEAAAALFLQAIAAEDDEEARQRYRDNYIEAMVASGRVIEAIDTQPESKETLENLLYQIDEGELEVTKEETRQLVALYLKRNPDSLDAVSRVAGLAIEDERYEEAERILQSALASLPAAESNTDDASEADDENKGYRAALGNLLASALWKSGKYREALAVPGNRTRHFEYLGQIATAEERWDDVRKLLELRQPAGDEDPELDRLAGELAAHDGRWDDAIRHLERAQEAVPEEKRWQFAHRLPQVYAAADRGVEYYSKQEDAEDAFENLGRCLVADEDWTALEALVAAHRGRSPDDPRIAKLLAEEAWERGNDEEYLKNSAILLSSNDEDVLPRYAREATEDKRLIALLRCNRTSAALELAKENQRQTNDASFVAIVKAAAGEVGEAQRLARESAETAKSAATFYSHSEVGRAFLSQPFAELQRDFPVELPHELASTNVLFLSTSAWPLEASDVAAIEQEVGIKAVAPVERVPVLSKRITRAFALRFDVGSLWIAAGEGKYSPQWSVDDAQDPIAQRVNNSTTWLAVGAAAWTESDRKRIAPVARRIADKLVEGREAVFCVPDRDYWQGFAAYSATPELIAAWQSRGRVPAQGNQSFSLRPIDWQSEVAANRQFARSLREAVRAFEADPHRKFEVWASAMREPAIDPLQLRVGSVTRDYGSLQFDGTLENQSLLVSELKPGLSARLHEYEVQAWRLDDADPVYRP